VRSRFSPRASVAAVCLFLVGGGVAADAAQAPTNRDQSRYTELHEPGFPIKGNLRFVPAAEASLRDDEVVIGVVVGGEARAYPVNLMWGPPNEALDDVLGGHAIVATWCPVAHSGAVYERTVDGRRLKIGAVGLQNGVFVLYDAETGSRWSQVSGRAARGPLAGRALTKAGSVLTTWGAWRRLQPATSVYVDPALPGRRRFTEETLQRITLAGGGPIVNEDLVAGVEADGAARAYLVRALAGPRVLADFVGGAPVVVALAADSVTVRAFRRTLDGRTLSLSLEGGGRMRDAETGSSWDVLTGRAVSGPSTGRSLDGLVVTTALWYAWRSQQPDTTLWPEPAASVR
jgi:hypothetical protein